MWPPANVVQEHKRRANYIWVSLVALIFGYSLWLIISTYEKRNNPTVSISIEDDRYAFPTITICAFAGPWVGYGCDSPYYSCSRTMETIIYNPIGFENTNDDVYSSDASIINEAYPDSCVDIDQSNMTEVENESSEPLRLTIWAEWSLNNDTDEYEEEYFVNSEGAYVYFTDPEVPDPLGSHDLSTFVGVIPYTRQLANDIPDSFTQTAITMKLTESINLDGTNVKTHSAATISSNDYLIPYRIVDSYTVDTAILFMEILQPDLTHTIRKEVDLLEWAELLGSIGGTWEILLVLWGIFFIAIKSGQPELKGRNLVKTVKTGVQNVVRGAASIASRVITKRGSREPPPSEGKETLPTWDMPLATTSDGVTDQALRSPPACDFSTSGPMSSSGGHLQASSDTHRGRPSVDCLICAPSRDIPVIVDFPRPAPKPI